MHTKKMLDETKKRCKFVVAQRTIDDADLLGS